jgi:hypothetical protein
MSKFNTNIPVDIDAAFAKLPAGSRVVNFSVDHAKKELVVEWEHDQLKTPYSVPIGWPLDALMAGTLPNMAKDLRTVSVPTPPEPIVEKPSEMPTYNVKVGLDKQAVNRNKSRK